MILTGPEIRRQVELGDIEIDPFVPEHVNPASVDLTLGDKYLVYKIEYENPYAGNYAGETARGPVASRSWRQFR